LELRNEKKEDLDLIKIIKINKFNIKNLHFVERPFEALALRCCVERLFDNE
jgi:hypothetical protein